MGNYTWGIWLDAGYQAMYMHDFAVHVAMMYYLFVVHQMCMLGWLAFWRRLDAYCQDKKKPISQRTVAGVESYGMMCSAKELGIGDNGDEIVELDSAVKIGDKYKG